MGRNLATCLEEHLSPRFDAWRRGRRDYRALHAIAHAAHEGDGVWVPTGPSWARVWRAVTSTPPAPLGNASDMQLTILHALEALGVLIIRPWRPPFHAGRPRHVYQVSRNVVAWLAEGGWNDKRAAAIYAPAQSRAAHYLPLSRYTAERPEWTATEHAAHMRAIIDNGSRRRAREAAAWIAAHAVTIPHRAPDVPDTTDEIDPFADVLAPVAIGA